MIVGFLKMGALWVPICPSGIEGPQEPAEKKEPAANFGLDRDNLGLNWPSGIRTRAYKRSRLIMHHPSGGAYAPEGCIIEPGTSRRRVDVRPRKEKEIATYNGCPYGAPICMPQRGMH